MPKRYENPWSERRHGLADVLRWKLGLGEKVVPTFPDAHAAAPMLTLTHDQLHGMPAHGWRVTWLGHASFLLSGCGVHLLIDPIFSAHCGPLPWLRFKRKIPPPCGMDALPPITAVLLTHTHYDHCDLPTLRRLGKHMPLIVPAGHAAWFSKMGFQNVTTCAWWQSVEVAEGVRVTATPAQHFTARTLWDRNRGHWCGWCLSGGGSKLWHSGDSGYCPAFREIGSRLGPLDFGMIAIGAYEPRWFMRSLHINPREAVMAFQDTGCRMAMGMHWGTFHLSDEPLGEPPLLLARELLAANIAPDCFNAGSVGQQWSVTNTLEGPAYPPDPPTPYGNHAMDRAPTTIKLPAIQKIVTL